MKKIISLLLAVLLITAIASCALAAKKPACKHKDYTVIELNDESTGYYTFWVPSCPGHPWGHNHQKPVIPVFEWRQCKNKDCMKIFRGPTIRTEYGCEFCTYND